MRGAEVGATFAGAAFDGQVVVFTQRIDDAVVRTTLPNRRFFRVNRNRFTSHGVEATAGGRAGPFTWRGDVTLQRPRIADATLTDPTQEFVEDVPSTFGSLLVGARPARDTELNLRVRALGESRCTNPATGTLDRLAGASAVDVGAERSWRGAGLFSRIRAMLQVENVYDVRIYDKCGLPQAGRTVRVGFTLG